MSEQLLELIAWLSPCFALMGLLIFRIKRGLVKKQWAVLPVYLAGALSFDLASRFFGRYLENNLILVPIYGLFELIMFTWLFSQLLKVSHKKYLLVVSGVVAAWLLYEAGAGIWLSVSRFQSTGRAFSSLSIVCYSIMLHLQQLRVAEQKSYSHFWLNTLITLYFLISSMWFLTVNFFVNKPTPTVFYLWLVFAISTPLFYCFLPLSLRRHGKTLKH